MCAHRDQSLSCRGPGPLWVSVLAAVWVKAFAARVRASGFRPGRVGALGLPMRKVLDRTTGRPAMVFLFVLLV